MALELCLLVYVRSLRQSSFSMYIDALTELIPWFFAVVHTNYARWIPVHLRDMTELPTRHPDEQNNACIKSDGGAVGLTDNPSALRRWMVAGPEVAALIEDLHSCKMHTSSREDEMRYSTMIRHQVCRKHLGKMSIHSSMEWKNWATHSKRKAKTCLFLTAKRLQIILSAWDPSMATSTLRWRKITTWDQEWPSDMPGGPVSS